jgi:formylglycine-generating enzyme required for sulfatase activity
MSQVFIPAGEFSMGSLNTHEGADEDEFPQHRVYLDAFWIDQTVITNLMFAAFLNDKGNQAEGNVTWLDAYDKDTLIIFQEGIWQPRPGYENHPAVEVSWYGAQAYCNWAERRLPTEAEWEKTARADGDRIYPWGDEISCDKTVFANCKLGLQPVGIKPDGASPYGVLGLSGNVWEWVSDWYAPDYYFYSIANNPLGPEDGIARVLRGGSWEYDWKHLRAANRRNNGPATSMHDYGFRCVMEVP